MLPNTNKHVKGKRGRTETHQPAEQSEASKFNEVINPEDLHALGLVQQDTAYTFS